MNSLVKIILNIIPRSILTRLSFLMKPLIKIYLSGNKYIDPIDGSSFRKFLPKLIESKTDDLPDQ